MARTTNHLRARMSQRGITSDMIELVTRFGANEGDRVVLRRNDLKLLMEEMRRLERTALKAMDKGGLVVVEEAGCLITAYAADSYDRRKAVRSARGRSKFDRAVH